MNIIWEKLYFRIQSLFVFLQKKMIASKLCLPNTGYRIDLLRTLQALRGSIGSVEVFIDIGTNKGEFARIVADIYNPQVMICIEPNGDLNNDIKANTKPHNSIIINRAISDREGTMDFYIHSDSQMSSLFESNNELITRDFGEDDPDRTEKRTVQVSTLDKVFQENCEAINSKIVFLKIDTQGNELEVIKGGEAALKQVNFCLLEYMFQTPYKKQYGYDDLINLMAVKNFSCLGPMHTSYRETGEAGAVLFLFENKTLSHRGA